MTPPIVARTVLDDEDLVTTGEGPALRDGAKALNDAEGLVPAPDRSLEELLVEPLPRTLHTRPSTLIDAFEVNLSTDAPISSDPVHVDVDVVSGPALTIDSGLPIEIDVKIDVRISERPAPLPAPSVLDLDDVDGELDDAAAAAAAPIPLTTPMAPPVLLAPPPSAKGAVQAVRTPSPPASEAARGRSRLGVDSVPPTARPWWESLFQDDYARFATVRSAAHVEADVRFIEERLNLAPGARILDLACGDGAHAATLASRGFDVVGIDTSLPLLARASARAQSTQQRVRFQQLDMRELDESAVYDGAVIWDHGFGFFDDEVSEAVLARILRALRPRGQLLIDLANRDYVVPRLPSLVWFEGQRCICMDDAHLDESSSRLVVHRTVLFEEGRSREYDYSMRLFASHELRAMLVRAGFRVVEVSGHIATPGAFFGADSQRLIVLAERPLAD